MRDWLVFFVLLLVIMGLVLSVFYLPDWVLTRRRRRPVDHSAVSARWLADHVNDKTGDRS